MMRRPRTTPTPTSGLVPMADMLSNTVGIMLFILAFTVLQTGSALIPKRLPIENKDVDRKPVFFVCFNQRLLPLDVGLQKKLLDGLGKPTYETAESWVTQFTLNRTENEFFMVQPKGEARFNRGAFQSTVKLELLATYKPKQGVGDSLSTFKSSEAHFERSVSELDEEKHFIYFLVYPDSIDIFRTARAYAEEMYGLAYGWSPVTEAKPVSFSLGGGRGVEPRIQ